MAVARPSRGRTGYVQMVPGEQKARSGSHVCVRRGRSSATGRGLAGRGGACACVGGAGARACASVARACARVRRWRGDVRAGIGGEGVCARALVARTHASVAQERASGPCGLSEGWMSRHLPCDSAWEGPARAHAGLWVPEGSCGSMGRLCGCGLPGGAWMGDPVLVVGHTRGCLCVCPGREEQP